MKKAVIHHSDYQSEDEMKTAISRHFVERNCYFRDPKRAGKKIWQIDFFQDMEGSDVEKKSMATASAIRWLLRC